MKWAMKSWWRLAFGLVLASLVLVVAAMIMGRPGLATAKQVRADEVRAQHLSERLQSVVKEAETLRQDLQTAQSARQTAEARLSEEQRTNAALREDLSRAATLLKQPATPGSPK